MADTPLLVRPQPIQRRTYHDHLIPYTMLGQVFIGGLFAGVTALVVAKILGNFETDPFDAIYKDYRLYLNAAISGAVGAGGFALAGSVLPTPIRTWKKAYTNEDIKVSARLILNDIYDAFFSILNAKFFAAGAATFISFLLAMPLLLHLTNRIAPNSTHNVVDFFISGLLKGSAACFGLLIFMGMAWALDIPMENLDLAQVATAFFGFQVGGGIASRSDSTVQQLLVPPFTGGLMATAPPLLRDGGLAVKYCFRACGFFRPRLVEDPAVNWTVMHDKDKPDQPAASASFDDRRDIPGSGVF